jgi:glycosyltransferase involved in cell wall biosynthesis
VISFLNHGTNDVRIAIDARKLFDFGIGTYIRNLLTHLARIDHETEYILLCREQDSGIAEDLGENFRTVPTPSANYSISEQFRIPMSLRREHADLFHAPHYVLPPLTHCRAVVTIHDCIHLIFPQYLPSRLARIYARAALWSAARRADRILTGSEASKNDILRCLKVPAEKVTVIYHAIDDRLMVDPPAAQMALVRERYLLNDPYVLYVGNIKPHKNVERLIDAFSRLRKQGFDHLKLLIIGDEISKHPRLRREVHRLKLHKHVRFLGFVPVETLAALYRLAGVFVFPSLYEGFGLPPLEAMACGTPVVTSNVSSLPEVVGDAAFLIDPYDPDSIADGMRRVLTDGDLRESLRARGFTQVRRYSWDVSVRRLRDIYGEVLESDAI